MQQFGNRPPSHPSSHRPFHSRSTSQPDFFFFPNPNPKPSSPASSLSDSPEMLPRGSLQHRRSKSAVQDSAGEDDLIKEFMNLESLGDSMENNNNNNTTNSESEAESRQLFSKGGSGGRHSRTLSMDSNSLMMSKGGLDLTSIGLGGFSNAEMEKIMANHKLAELALADPKRVKRILANRQSAARSKQRKIHYISELEQKVKTLQAEATTLSAQVTILQRDTSGLANQNNELKIRVQAMEQQAHLRDALNEALNAEVHRLKLANGEIDGAHSNPSCCSIARTPINSFQLQHQTESTDNSLVQIHHHHHHHQHNNFPAKLESN